MCCSNGAAGLLSGCVPHQTLPLLGASKRSPSKGQLVCSAGPGLSMTVCPHCEVGQVATSPSSPLRKR